MQSDSVIWNLLCIHFCHWEIVTVLFCFVFNFKYFLLSFKSVTVLPGSITTCLEHLSSLWFVDAVSFGPWIRYAFLPAWGFFIGSQPACLHYSSYSFLDIFAPKYYLYLMSYKYSSMVCINVSHGFQNPSSDLNISGCSFKKCLSIFVLWFSLYIANILRSFIWDFFGIVFTGSRHLWRMMALSLPCPSIYRLW